ncbi:hypothetical protein PQ459_14190 [Chryseobacterium sp. KACC 21268]|nr:hypothetical protein PQ459_14190 [Chryseobacterium sp. KACC 21268]
MKNIICTLSLLIFNPVFAQVIIGNTIGTVPSGQKESVLLEFASGQNKGIILPYVRIVPSGSRLSEGTMVLDATDPQRAKIIYYNGVIDMNSSDGWFDLSNGDTADLTSIMGTQPSPAAVTEFSESKMIIGSNSSSSDGVLVLESQSKAMVLPMVTNTDDIPDPAPGMLVYINKEGAKRLAVYNGNAWTYWKPND